MPKRGESVKKTKRRPLTDADKILYENDRAGRAGEKRTSAKGPNDSLVHGSYNAKMQICNHVVI